MYHHLQVFGEKILTVSSSPSVEFYSREQTFYADIVCMYLLNTLLRKVIQTEASRSLRHFQKHISEKNVESRSAEVSIFQPSNSSLK